MKVLFYTGYFKNPWSPINQTGIGGSEVAIIKVAESLVKFGWEVIVSGNVESGKWNGVEWIPTDRIHKERFNDFDVIVGVSYIHFLIEFEKYSAKKLFWVHNTDYHPWYKGKEIQDSINLLNPDRLDGIICLTNWHKEQWSQKYSIDPSRIHIIGNGIDPQSFIGHAPKIKNRFIWSSAPERGLYELLNNWPKIKSIKPDAELHVYSPGYQIATSEKWGREGLKGVTFKGSVGQVELHSAMLEAEYWMYLTNYEETYCITALEMQNAGVFPIVTEVAALKETVNSGIKVKNAETKWDLSIKVLDEMSASLKNRVIKENKQHAKMSTWSSRSYEWKQLFDKI